MPDERPAADTLDFILEHTKGAADKQLADADAMDSKVSSVFGVASAVIGLAGLSAAVSSSITTSPTEVSRTFHESHTPFIGAMLLCALVAYAIVAVSTILAWRIQAFERTDYATTLWSGHWSEPVDEVKWWVIASIPAIFTHNEAIIEDKANWITRALIACAFEVAFVGVAVAVEAF